MYREGQKTHKIMLRNRTLINSLKPTLQLTLRIQLFVLTFFNLRPFRYSVKNLNNFITFQKIIEMTVYNNTTKATILLLHKFMVCCTGHSGNDVCRAFSCLRNRLLCKMEILKSVCNYFTTLWITSTIVLYVAFTLLFSIVFQITIWFEVTQFIESCLWSFRSFDSTPALMMHYMMLSIISILSARLPPKLSVVFGDQCGCCKKSRFIPWSAAVVHTLIFDVFS